MTIAAWLDNPSVGFPEELEPIVEAANEHVAQAMFEAADTAARDWTEAAQPTWRRIARPITERVLHAALVARLHCDTCGSTGMVRAADCDCTPMSSMNYSECRHMPEPCPDCPPSLGALLQERET